MKGNFKFSLLAILTSLLLIACSDSPSPKTEGEGTQDTGGGIVKLSTNDDIKRAVEEGLKILRQDETLFTIEQFGRFQMQTFTDEESAKIREAFQTIKFPGAGPVNPKSYRVFNDYATMDRVYYKEKGACPAKDRNNAFSSVSTHTLEARVCFSLENLRTIPLTSILKHVTGLWAHEIAHMNGYSEEMAELIGKMTEFTFPNLVLSFQIMYQILDTAQQIEVELKVILVDTGYFGLISANDWDLSAWTGEDQSVLNFHFSDEVRETLPTTLSQLAGKCQLLSEVLSKSKGFVYDNSMHLQILSVEDQFKSLCEGLASAAFSLQPEWYDSDPFLAKYDIYRSTQTAQSAAALTAQFIDDFLRWEPVRSKGKK